MLRPQSSGAPDGLAWLADLAANLRYRRRCGPKATKAPRDQRQCAATLVVRDLAAIFTLISGEPATRRSDPATGKNRRPVLGFREMCVGRNLRNKRRPCRRAQRLGRPRLPANVGKGPKTARQKLAEGRELSGRGPSPTWLWTLLKTRFREYSPFVANIQFRHTPNGRDLIYGPSLIYGNF